MADLTPEQETEIQLALGRSQKIQAVKLYRQFTGCELVDAKKAVERMQPIVTGTVSERRPQGGGGLKLLIILILLAAAAWLVVTFVLPRLQGKRTSAGSGAATPSTLLNVA